MILTLKLVQIYYMEFNNYNQTPVFKFYKQEFTCSCCGEKSIMGIVGYSKTYPKICDLCLVDVLEEKEKIEAQLKDKTSK